MYNGLFIRTSKIKGTTPPAGNQSDMGVVIPQSRPTPATQESTDEADGQATLFASRPFGVYTFAAALMRLYGAYAVHNPVAYQLALWGYVIAAAHYTSEALVYR
jgi:hypothetical protein